MFLHFLFHKYDSKSTHCKFSLFFISTLKLVFILKVIYFCYFHVVFIMKIVKIFLSINTEVSKISSVSY